MKYLFPSILLTLLSSCSVFDSEQNLEETLVIATANDPVFSVLNKTDKPIVYVVVETQTLAVIFLAEPCIDFSPNLEPNENIQFNYSDIIGWHEGAKSAMIIWTDCQGSSSNETIKL